MSSELIREQFKDNREFQEAQKKDQDDYISIYRSQFSIPKENGQEVLYFAGHSLGLKPHRASQYINEELQAWSDYGVEGHFKSAHPWVSYHETVTESLARLVGALPHEVVAMNSLTVNLHLMMVSFYQPKGARNKILIESSAFPSDQYAVNSQARFHGLNPKDVVVELPHSGTESYIDDQFILDEIKRLGPELSLVMIGQCNYLTGQKFNISKIAEAAHSVGAKVGFNLAHGAGNLKLNLHEDNADFAVWCSYKYLNSGPGGIAGAFIHERHHSLLDQKSLQDQNRFEGWWGHNKSTRFKMGPEFDPIASIEAWQLSNPPIFQLAALRASLELFDSVGMDKLRVRGDQLTNYFETQIQSQLNGLVSVVTPNSRGSMLCLRVNKDPHLFKDFLIKNHAIVDFREPNIIRATPVPLYNTYQDIFLLVQTMKGFFSDKK